MHTQKQQTLAQQTQQTDKKKGQKQATKRSRTKQHTQYRQI